MEESVEFRFREGVVGAAASVVNPAPGATESPASLWRGQLSRADRWVGSPTNRVRIVSATGSREVWMTDRVVVRAGAGRDGKAVQAAWERQGLRWAREGAGAIQILQARDPWSAARAATALSAMPGVELSVPVMRRRLALHRSYALRPNDPFFSSQWHLENRDAAGQMAGPDLHVRSAWPVAEGSGVTVAICDDGFETDHPDLRQAAARGPHFNFVTGVSNTTVYGSHATAVAGLVAATDDNGVGVSGVAPKAGLASWVIFDAFEITSDEALMDMFQNRTQEVAVQNHSWGNASSQVSRPTAIEAAAISNAVVNGRSGRGVVMVRSGGNDRELGSNANDDAYASDPSVIAVAAIRKDGGIAGYSNPGACLLVGAPSGDEDDFTLPTEGVATTDRVGTRGYNRQTGANSLADYALQSTGFSGTSASAPQIAGVVALVLSANPRLTVRDVQQVLIHAARHPESNPPDPDRRRNGAGYGFSHNDGFGVPDAGLAVRLAETWTSRPPLVTVSLKQAEPLTVPDAGLRLWLQQGGSPERDIVSESAPGLHPDEPTGKWPLVHVGLADAPLTQDLTGKVALIQRGGNTFREKLTYALRAGARFAVFYNNTGGTTLDSPGYTDFVGIIAGFIPQNDGEALAADLQAGAVVNAELRLNSVATSFEVTRTLACEHVGLRVRSNHVRRGDLRITLVSPSGTRSVLQNQNFDTEPGPVDWTYWSTQHFYEPSKGTWRAEFSDESTSREGDILEVELIVRGVELEDSDADGLDDGWERRWFGNLDRGTRDDVDEDGSSNAREQVLGTDPTQADRSFRITLDAFDAKSFRLSWPAMEGFRYSVLRRGFLDGASPIETVIPGRFPEVDWVVPSTALPGVVYQIERTSE
jgi:subtilisin family serine protease